MTDEELKELVAANSAAIARLEALAEANDRRWRENDRRLAEMRDEIRASRLVTDPEIRMVSEDTFELCDPEGFRPRVFLTT